MTSPEVPEVAGCVMDTPVLAVLANEYDSTALAARAHELRFREADDGDLTAIPLKCSHSCGVPTAPAGLGAVTETLLVNLDYRPLQYTYSRTNNYSVWFCQAEGYVVPDLGDGVFTASFGEHGLVNVTRISDIDHDAVPGVSARDGLAPRALPISRFGCYRASQNHNDWEIVRANFKNMCNQGVRIPGNGIRYAVSGVQIAFGCSWGGENGCSGAEYDEFLRYINGNCGGWYGGWVDMDSWKKQYGMEQKGEAICGHSISWR